MQQRWLNPSVPQAWAHSFHRNIACNSGAEKTFDVGGQMCCRARLRYHHYHDVCQSCTQDRIMSKFQRAVESL